MNSYRRYTVGTPDHDYAVDPSFANQTVGSVFTIFRVSAVPPGNGQYRLWVSGLTAGGGGTVSIYLRRNSNYGDANLHLNFYPSLPTGNGDRGTDTIIPLNTWCSSYIDSSGKLRLNADHNVTYIHFRGAPVDHWDPSRNWFDKIAAGQQTFRIGYSHDDGNLDIAFHVHFNRVMTDPEITDAHNKVMANINGSGPMWDPRKSPLADDIAGLWALEENGTELRTLVGTDHLTDDGGIWNNL